MGISGDRNKIIDRNIRPAKPIEGYKKTSLILQPAVEAEVVNIKMRKHHPCINTCIRTPGSGDGDRRTEYGREGFFQGLLHAVGIRLRLPAMKGSAVVSEFQEKSHKSLSRYVYP